MKRMIAAVGLTAMLLLSMGLLEKVNAGVDVSIGFGFPGWGYYPPPVYYPPPPVVYYPPPVYRPYYYGYGPGVVYGSGWGRWRGGGKHWHGHKGHHRGHGGRGRGRR